MTLFHSLVAGPPSPPSGPPLHPIKITSPMSTDPSVGANSIQLNVVNQDNLIDLRPLIYIDRFGALMVPNSPSVMMVN